MTGRRVLEALRQAIEAPESTEVTTHRERILESERKRHASVGVGAYGASVGVEGDWDDRSKLPTASKAKS